MKTEHGDDLEDAMVPLADKMELMKTRHRLKELAKLTEFNAKLRLMYEQALDGSISAAALPATATGASGGAPVPTEADDTEDDDGEDEEATKGSRAGAAAPKTGAVGASAIGASTGAAVTATGAASGGPGDGDEGKCGGLVTQGPSAGAAATDTEAGVGMKRVREDGVGAREDGKTEEEPEPVKKRRLTDSEFHKHLKNREPAHWNFQWNQAKAKANAANDEKAEDAPKMTI